MKRDNRFDDDAEEAAPPAGLLHRLGEAVTARELRVLDGTLGIIQRWRSRIAPAEEEEERRPRRGRAEQREAEVAPAPVAVHHRLRGFLIVLGLVVAAAAAGMAYSHRLFADALRSNEVVIDDLRDQLAQMEKAEAQGVARLAKDQNLLAEQRKTIREQEAQMQEYEAQIAALRQQLAALTPPPAPRETVRSSAVLRPSRTPPAAQKSGNCTASGTNAAADLSRCLEKFNRP